MPKPIPLSRTAGLVVLALSLAGCVVEPFPPEGAPVAYEGCCYAYPEYPAYYPGYYYPNVYLSGRGGYGGYYEGGHGGWRR